MKIKSIFRLVKIYVDKIIMLNYTLAEAIEKYSGGT